jgi:hypothetical protein
MFLIVMFWPILKQINPITPATAFSPMQFKVLWSTKANGMDSSHLNGIDVPVW